MPDEAFGALAAKSLNLSQFSGFDMIKMELKSTNKGGVLHEIAELLSKSPHVPSSELAYKALIEREHLVSTGMGFGVAMPHGRGPEFTGTAIAFARSTKGVDFDALDGEPVHLFFAVIVPVTAIQLHLQILASLTLMLQNEENRKRLLKAQFPQEILSFLDGEK